MADARSTNQTVLVVGGGMSGLSSALEAAEAGFEVIIVEKNPYLGGRVAQLNQYFPKMCPPTCGLEINFRRVKANPKIRFYTQAEVADIQGESGAYTVTVKQAPKYINEKCTACGKCAEAIETTVDSAFDMNLGQVKACYLPYLNAYPLRYVMDPALIGTADAAKAAAACEYGAIDLEAAEKTTELSAGAIIWAAGWNPYSAEAIEYYGYSKNANVITNVEMERLASQEGPTGGKILRPSDGQPPKSVAFIQCAGSRDLNHLAYCSGICCLASIKQAQYVLEQLPEAAVQIMFIDIRAQDRLDVFYQDAQNLDNLTFIKSKVANIVEDAGTKNLTLEAENTATGQQIRQEVDLVVLATGMVPNTEGLPEWVAKDDYGFIQADSGQAGFVGVGCARKPYNVAECVQDATGAALKAIQAVAGR